MDKNLEFVNDLTAEEIEQIDLEESESEEGIKIQRYAFNSFRIERSIRDILNWVDKGKIVIPEFQRDFVWNYNQSSRFIESVLLGLPIPDFFMFRTIDSQEKTEKYILIDGLQRYTTIRQFVDGRYQISNINRVFKINDKSSQWFNKTYDKLNDNDKDFFQDFSLKINVFDSIDNSDIMKKLYMTAIFERINTGSSKLSNQEVRNAVYASDITADIRKSANSQTFLSLLGSDQKKYLQRCKNEEFYLRLLAYYQVYKQLKNNSSFYVDSDPKSRISSSKDVMLCNFLFYSNNKSIDYKTVNSELKQVLEKILNFSTTAFCTVKRDCDEISTKIHEIFSEALTIALLEGSKISITPQKFDEYKIKLWRNQEDYPWFFQATTELKSVENRVDIMRKILSGEL
mgnify:FL=1